MSFVNVSDAANLIERQYGIAVEPRELSAMLYRRELDVKKCPVNNGRRMIPREYIGEIARVLRRRHGLSAEGGLSTRPLA